jgi:hypothetical protein
MSANDLNSDVEVAIVEEAVEPPTHPDRRQAWALPVLLGVLLLLADVFIIARLSTVFFTKNVLSSTSLLLMIASLMICLVLIAYGLGLRGLDSDGTEASRRGSHARTIGVTLLLAGHAPLTAAWSLQVNRTAIDRRVEQPCIEVYQQAQNIAKDNPRFRMPATNRDEVRCTVNAVLGR